MGQQTSMFQQIMRMFVNSWWCMASSRRDYFRTANGKRCAGVLICVYSKVYWAFCSAPLTRWRRGTPKVDRILKLRWSSLMQSVLRKFDQLVCSTRWRSMAKGETQAGPSITETYISGHENR